MIKLTINGKTIEVSEGTTILDAAKMLNIEIPTLCHHPKLTPFGGCRLCIVEVKGAETAHIMHNACFRGNGSDNFNTCS